MANGLASVVFTTEITDTSFTLNQSMGIQQISIYNSSSTNGSVTGTRSLGATASSALTLVEGQTMTFQAIEASVIESLIITAPSGCTLQIIAQ
tara:strand:- start:9170 stop:9448 length:279 start_codon:yes stop_codon:yes gene_type:complete